MTNTETTLGFATRYRPKFLRLIGVTVALCLSASFSANADDGPEPYSPSDVEWLYVYYAHSRIPLPEADMAMQFSEYRDAQDEFERRERFSQFQSIIQEDFNKIKALDSFVINTSAKLGDYDFDVEQLPLQGLSETTFFQWNTRNYGIPGLNVATNFNNMDAFTYLPLDPEKAKQLLRAVTKRTVTLEIIFKPVKTREERLTRRTFRTITSEVTKLVLKNPKNKKVLLTCESGWTGVSCVENEGAS